MATKFAIKTDFIGIDKTSQVFSDMSRNGKRAAKQTETAFSKAGRKIGGAFKDLGRHAFMGLTALGAVAVKKSIDSFLDFESEMLNVKAITKSTQEDYDRMSKSALDMAKDSVFSSAEVAKGMKFLGIAGWNTNKIIEGMPGLLQLAAASQTDLALTSDILSDTMTAFKIKASEAVHVADVFAGVATSTNTTVEQLGEAMKDAAPAAQVWGTSIEETSAILGTMANNAIKGGRAGTSFKNIVLNLAKPSKQASKWLRKMNIEVADQHGKFRKLTDVLADVSDGVKKLSQRDAAAATTAIFKKRAFAGVTSIITQQRGEVDKLTDAFKNNTDVAKTMAEVQLSGASGAIKKMNAAWDVMTVTMVSKVAPALQGIAEQLTGLLTGENQGQAKSFQDQNIENLKGGLGISTIQSTGVFQGDDSYQEEYQRYLEINDRWIKNGEELTKKAGSQLFGSQDFAAFEKYRKATKDFVSGEEYKKFMKMTEVTGGKSFSNMNDDFMDRDFKQSLDINVNLESGTVTTKPVETLDTVKTKIENSYRSEMIKEVRRETNNVLTIKDETGKAKMSGDKRSPYKLENTMAVQ